MVTVVDEHQNPGHPDSPVLPRGARVSVARNGPQIAGVVAVKQVLDRVEHSLRNRALLLVITATT